jgi:hydroxymethylglutaryl-CoA synthase
VPTDDTPALIATGVYLPPFAVRAGRRVVAVPNGDEDATTMAIEAGRDCLAGIPVAVDELHLALARPDLVHGPAPEVIREALGLDPAVGTTTTAGDAAAGLTALLAATDAIAAGRVRSVLVIASEPGDGAQVSAAAVAVLVSATGAPAPRLTGHRSTGDVVFGRWSDGAGTAHQSDGRYVEHRVAAMARTTVAALHGDGGPAPDAVTGVAARAAAEACGAGRDAVTPDRGVAGPLLALLVAADRAPGSGVTVLATTSTRVLAVTATVDAAAPRLLPEMAAPATEPRQPVETPSSPPLSLPTSSPFFQRASRELLRLQGARCRACGHVVFPPSQRPVCPSCHGYDFDRVPISRTGVVHTYTVNRFLPVGFGAEMILVLGDLDDGSRYWAPTSGLRAEEVSIGTPVELRLRRFTDHGGAPTYAMKFVARRHTPDRTGVPA